MENIQQQGFFTESNGRLIELLSLKCTLMGIGCSIGLTDANVGGATPPECRSFDREQRIDVDINQNTLMRVSIYIGQGDAHLIQLPEMISYTVDGGPSARQLEAFLHQLYLDPSRVEHIVLTHHESDHVNGMLRDMQSERTRTPSKITGDGQGVSKN